MNDKELIEMAAKAAGIGWQMYDYEKLRSLKHMVLKRDMWNPLENDGDALRLAVKIGGIIHLYTDTITYQYSSGDAWSESGKGDMIAATRRAIVSAAAAIGKAMP